MKKLLLIFLLLGPISVFAWADTDRICADGTKQWVIRNETSFQVSYPWEVASVWWSISKVFIITKPHPMDVEGYYALYYVMNIGEGNKKRAELYTYNCATKKPKLLLNIPINTNKEDYYSLDFSDNTNLVLVGRMSGMMYGSTETLIGYDFYKNKKLFSLNNKLIPEWEIQWFVSWKDAWYMYFSPAGFQQSAYNKNPLLYKVDKKTLKITKL